MDRGDGEDGEDKEVSNEIDDEDSEAMLDGKRGRVMINESSDWSLVFFAPGLGNSSEPGRTRE